MVPYTRLNKFRYRIRQVFFTDVACMHPMFSAQLTGKSVARTLIGQDCECGLEIIFAQVDYISLLSLFVTENPQKLPHHHSSKCPALQSSNCSALPPNADLAVKQTKTPGTTPER